MRAVPSARSARTTWRRPRTWLLVLGAVALLGYAVNSVEDTDPVDAAPDTVSVAPAQSATPEPTTENAEPSPVPPSETPEPPSNPTTREPVDRPTHAPEAIEAEPAVVGTPGSALAVLAELEVKGRAPATGYDRDLFQYRSYDLDRNGCDARIICIRGRGRSELPW